MVNYRTPQSHQNSSLSTTFAVMQNQQRIVFIDIARTIAILLMLQGHFITMTYSDYGTRLYELRTTGTSGLLLFDIWVRVRGFTAPLFFTITGLVFTYLMLKGNTTDTQHFWKKKRVTRGLKRASQLIIVGYLLQINLMNVPFYFRGGYSPNLFAFHILQCIGFGLLLLISIAWLAQKTRLNVSVLLFLTGSFFFVGHAFLQYKFGNELWLPKQIPVLFQNMLNGPKANFPFFPWLGFVGFGGFLGSLIFKFSAHLHQRWFPLVFVGIAVLIVVFGKTVGFSIDWLLGETTPFFLKRAWLFDKVAEAILLLGILLTIEQYVTVRPSTLLSMGQNTFAIYNVHAILLYGAITGISLRTFLEHQLNGWQSVVGAFLFLTTIYLYVKYMELINRPIFKVLPSYFSS